jgi:hypothetical protein
LLEENFSQHKFEFPSPYEEEVERTFSKLTLDEKAKASLHKLFLTQMLAAMRRRCGEIRDKILFLIDIELRLEEISLLASSPHKKGRPKMVEINVGLTHGQKNSDENDF